MMRFERITPDKRGRIRKKIWKLIFKEDIYGEDIETILNELIDDWRKLGDCELKFCRVCGVLNSFTATQCECGASF
jgi:hypothetical protein